MQEIPSLPPLRLDSLSKQALHDYFANAWQLYETLFGAVVADDSLLRRPDPLRHPLVFYLGHTAVFYVNKLKQVGAMDRGLDDSFERLFAVGVDPENAHELPQFDWPAVAAVRDYRRQVFDRVHDWIDGVELRPFSGPSVGPLWALLMASEHDRIHFETSSVLMRRLPADLLRRPVGWSYAPLEGGRDEGGDPVHVGAGEALLGKPRKFPTFGWDNEYGSRLVKVAPFEATRDLVTNREFLEFVRDGGYRRRELWSEEGWTWRQETAVEHPLFWVPTENDFRYRAMFDDLRMPHSWPVEVNAHEAWAYCLWRGGGWRLPSEGEFTRIADGCPMCDGDSIFTEGYNLNLAYGSPTPVGHCELTESPLGLRDCYGNVWQWLRDDFNPLEGFEAHPLYTDLSLPYFDDRHSMMLGGSWASTGTSGSRFYRQWFRRKFHQHAGFRLVRS